MEEDADYGEYISQLEKSGADKDIQIQKLQQGNISSSQFSATQDENLIRYQLDTDGILERIEHFLKGDKINVDDEGNVSYITPEEEDRNFNEYGVNEFMRIISMYLNKETFLSNYDEQRINEIIADLGDALNNFLYCNYEKVGMDTDFKISKYTLIVLNILHTIESCYRRAIGGAEQINIRTGRIVTQSQPIQGSSYGMGPQSMVRKRKWNPFDKSTW